jgi:hypothetical protein
MDQGGPRDDDHGGLRPVGFSVVYARLQCRPPAAQRQALRPDQDRVVCRREQPRLDAFGVTIEDAVAECEAVLAAPQAIGGHDEAVFEKHRSGREARDLAAVDEHGDHLRSLAGERAHLDEKLQLFDLENSKGNARLECGRPDEGEVEGVIVLVS